MFEFCVTFPTFVLWYTYMFRLILSYRCYYNLGFYVSYIIRIYQKFEKHDDIMFLGFADSFIFVIHTKAVSLFLFFCLNVHHVASATLICYIYAFY